MRAENHPLFPLVVVADCWLQRLLVWTPGQTDLIKTVALLLMVADHISMLCGLDNDWLRLAGRGAFPLFGLVWAMNLARHPQIQQRALNRLWIWAGVAQGGWILAGLRPDLGNILFAFAVSGQALAMMQGSPQNSEKSYAKVFRASVRAETSRLPVCGSAARRNRRLG